MIQATKTRVEYGDFQTPLELTEKICQKLIELGVQPDVIIEPTCGVGNFIKTSVYSQYSFQSVKRIIGIDINTDYIKKIEQDKQLSQDSRIKVQERNFFEFDWFSLIKELDKKILVLGNFPWVTNSQQGLINSRNLPQKTNFQNHTGLDALTGKSNFDISEWMLIQMIQWLQGREADLAMICKTSVSRKLLSYIHNQKLKISYCATYKIDAKKYFGANVDACLLYCHFDTSSQNYFCDVFDSLESSSCDRIGYQDNVLAKNVITFQKLQYLYNSKSANKWRSGIKHDCSGVMEFRKVDGVLMNGFGEVVDLEDTYLFPLLKGSDVAQNRVHNSDRCLLVTQKFIGEPTASIQKIAPKTWNYLELYAKYLDNRKSKIYQQNPRFSIFGVGHYTFLPWKIAICGLYKKLAFRLIGNLEDKPTVFDDTVYFLGFDNEQVANQTFQILTSPLATDFYSSLIFWDEKRPIKTNILNCLDLSKATEKAAHANNHF